ncbi:GNAT family N-acetyltransferase [Fusobacterium nucleatum subsp. nucleatum ATCC 25586]|uniref:GNAT family N-acetyltransferase n=1 Tax=Fusobacterium nucleatum subsp. nucleatum (strain ATCC 25586 / DSM 15643 / BCRC 10681 / CIP 101130 / JCM 8532 / KCTC 2640 / LMG 13131 / VPI 4355) TaxID=190304 RepID=A0ABM6TRT7_FUSNN|nr:GNAT family N-acetyltransferase [Fusobacterium nucleatum]AVQ15614.1 GNAT family N-acetyltransferase [Fusobacterium nucleatum subsp. nucleatum ATCC 25586]WMS28639.1 GNAT family N-acetyltransferase [Fusobacterium nucleatum]
MMEIKQLLNKEKDKALLFAKKVYIECKDESYSEQGIETFYNFINNKEITKSFKVYGAFEDNVLKGLIATDRQKRHISLFFVDKVSQGKGIGKELMKAVINNNENSYITVNSSRYAVPIYEKLGFVKMEEEKERDGLKFTPMKLILKFNNI